MLVCVSRGSYSCGKAFAESLAEKLGCLCIGREELLDRATEAGVAAGKLEMACLRPRGMTERMVLEREHFQAFSAAYLACRALDGPLVYHGRTGHLLLQNVPHVLRVRIVADMETRIRSVEQRLGLDRVKARRYIEDVENDRRRWVRTFYNLDWDAAAAYDVILNCDHASVPNLAAAFCKMAELPEFQETPAARHTLEDLLLAGQCRMALAKDDRTFNASFQVRAEHGVVTVTYLPRHAEAAQAIPEILQGVQGVTRVLPAMAATRILWVQERFDTGSPAFTNLLDLADRWEAAVELMRLTSTDGPPIVERAISADPFRPAERAATGGIEEDSAGDTQESTDDGGLEQTFTELAKQNRAGGRSTVRGNVRSVVDAVDTTTPYSLVVVGDAFLDKGKAARIRMTRELGNALHERLRVAVIQADEMKQTYLFGLRQLLTMLLFFGITAVIYLAVFTHQREVLEMLARQGTRWRVLSAVVVVLLVPLVAYSYGKATHLVLKLIRME